MNKLFFQSGKKIIIKDALNENPHTSHILTHPKNINLPKTRYLLVKGFQGFGNMISSLNICYHLAKKHNRILVIDWKNCIWDDEFDAYMTINNIDYMSFNDFYKQHCNNQSVYPVVFKGKLNAVFDTIIPKHGSKVILDPIKYIPSSISIVVVALNYHKIGFQSFNAFWKNVALTKPLAETLEKYKEQLGSYKAIHIRNSDQIQTNTEWIVSFLTKNQNYKIYVATDDNNMIDFCKQYHNNIYTFTTFFNADNKDIPLHYYKCDMYKKNCDTIIDLYLLANSLELVYAEVIVFQKVKHSSSYSILAKKIFDYLHNQEKTYNYVSFKETKLV
jgi:hypothetical protein